MDRLIALIHDGLERVLAPESNQNDDYTLLRVDGNKFFIRREHFPESGDEITCEDFVVEVTTIKKVILPRWLP